MQHPKNLEATSLYPNNIGWWIKKQGYTQEEVADEIGIARRTLSNYISGKRVTPRYYLERIAETIGCEIEDLTLQSEHQSSPSRHLQQGIQKSSTSDADWLMPLPPQPYFVHPYPLQKNFTGRVHERQRLTEWLTQDKRPVLALVALGGMGKSSLAWSWLQQDVLSLPEATRPHGVLWWSFYEPEATFALFLDQALIYTSSGTVNPRLMTSLYEKTQALLALLQRHHILLVLDGFERALRAYASMNAAYQGNDAPPDTQGNFRVCIDPHLGSFLRWLAAGPLSSKALLTSRLLPRELDGLAGCQCEELMALKTADAIAFLHAQGVQGTRVETEALCAFYGNHPLALRLLTGLIVNDPARPTDVAVAIDYHPLTELVQREHHILSLAYDALHPLLQQLLSQLAAFRSKVNYEMIKVVSPFETEKELKAGLRELVERGLLFFDREQRYYDLHPVLRRYAYARLLRKEDVHACIAEYFWSLAGKGLTVEVAETPRKIRAFSREPSSSSRSHMEHLEDLAPIIELCHHLIHAKQFEQAFGVYYHHLAGLLYHHLGAYQIVIELLQAFFPDDGSPLPVLERKRHSWLLDALAHAYSASGYPQRAVGLLRASIRIDQECNEKESLATSLWNLGVQLQVLGRLSESEQSLQECIALCHSTHDSFNKAKAHQYFALLRAYQGLFKEASQHINTAVSLFKELGAIAQEGAAWAYQALCLLLAGEIHAAFLAAQRARELADAQHYERDIIRAEWLLGAVLVRSALQEGERTSEILREAELHLSEALQRCRRIDMVDYEADLLLAWARLHHAQGAKQQAKASATEALVIANRSDFRALRADISNLLARLELEDGDHIAALNDARAALNDALCDGPPYCYKPAVEEAKHLLKTLNQLPQRTHFE